MWLPVDFEDDDLGPGGRFVTRRGGDPVRAGAAERQFLLSPHDFPDLDLPQDHPCRAELVATVPMPLDDETGSGTPPSMHVALVTYAPRFDPEREEWFVDARFAPGAAPDAFLRLGLVRYQPHAAPGLRCSPPVAQWSQLLPARRVEVLPAGDGLRVTVTGNAPFRRADIDRDDPQRRGIPLRGDRQAVQIGARQDGEGLAWRPADDAAGRTATGLSQAGARRKPGRPPPPAGERTT